MQQASGWETFVWPQWLPVRARLPLIAQITGAVALTALIVGPWWARIPESPLPSSPGVTHSPPVPLAATVTKSPAVSNAIAARTPVANTAPVRPAHLNLEVRHSFKSADLSVTVDGKPVIDRTLDGSGKRFKMFGKRPERGVTQSLDLAPGVRVVRVRLRSVADKFDQTRVERFELASASVAAIRIAADKSGMSLAADHPPLPPAPRAPAAAMPVAVPAPAPAAVAAAPVAAPAVAITSQEASAMVDLIQSLRSMLIAIAGFVASAATGFVVQEFLRRRRGLLFAEAAAPSASSVCGERRRRRRAKSC